MNTQLSELIGFSEGLVSDPRVLWESVKGFIRSFSISFASNLNKKRIQEINDLENKLSHIEIKMHASPSQELAQEREVIRIELHSLLRYRALQFLL